MTKQEEIPQILILRLWRGDLSYTDVNESKVKCVKGDVTLVPEGGKEYITCLRCRSQAFI